MSKRQTIAGRILFSAKVLALQGQRFFLDASHPLRKWPIANTRWNGLRCEVRSPLFVDLRPEERPYELGKVQNLRVAVRQLNGVEIPAGEIFSFWRQILAFGAK